MDEVEADRRRWFVAGFFSALIVLATLTPVIKGVAC